MKINSFDCDGVITIGIYPGPDDVIVTGRSFQERPETEKMLERKGITNRVFYQWVAFDDKTREGSGIHKGNTLNWLRDNGFEIQVHFEDDEVQIEQIRRIAPWVPIVHVVQNLVVKENVRHYEE